MSTTRLRPRPAPLVLVAWVLGASAACHNAPEPAPRSWTRAIDLTHAYDENTVYWPTAEGFQLTVDARGTSEGGYWYEANSFRAAEHGGTHLDAPVHFAEGMRSVEQIPVDQLIGPGVVVDVHEVCALDRDHLVSVAELESWEYSYGRIPDGAIVLLNTGFARHWPDRERYMGTAERGPDAVAKLHFPGLDPDAARWLVVERSIGAIGLDTPSIDRGQSTEFLAHRILFEANVPALENVTNLDQLPADGFQVVALPMKIAGGSGAPVRIVALLTGD